MRRRARVDALDEELPKPAQHLRDQLGERLARRHVQPVERIVENEAARRRAERADEEHLADLAGRDGAHRPVQQRVQAKPHHQVARRRPEVSEGAVHRASVGEQPLVGVKGDSRGGAGAPAVGARERALTQQRPMRRVLQQRLGEERLAGTVGSKQDVASSAGRADGEVQRRAGAAARAPREASSVEAEERRLVLDRLACLLRVCGR